MPWCYFVTGGNFFPEMAKGEDAWKMAHVCCPGHQDATRITQKRGHATLVTKDRQVIKWEEHTLPPTSSMVEMWRFRGDPLKRECAEMPPPFLSPPHSPSLLLILSSLDRRRLEFLGPEIVSWIPGDITGAPP